MRIEMPEKRKKYDREFREGAVRIVEETGKPIAQIARDLGLSVHTVEAHRQSIKRRLGIEGQAELIKYAVEHAREFERR